MAVRNKEEILLALNAVIGDNTSDEALTLIEDVNDTLSVDKSENWEEKYNELDKNWRNKYKERFFSSKPTEETEESEETEETKKYSYDELFKEEK